MNKIKRICLLCKKPFFKYPSAIKFGSGKFCSQQCYWKYPKSQEFKEKISFSMRGSKHPNWKGGIMRGRKDRNLMVYKNWRQSIFKRDGFTCQLCSTFNHKGLGKTIRLNAHHLKSWTHHPELRYSVSNGLTLCQDCHDEFRKVDLSELAKTREAERYVEINS